MNTCFSLPLCLFALTFLGSDKLSLVLLLNRNTIVLSAAHNARCLAKGSEKHTLAHFASFVLLRFPVMDLVAGPISKTGVVNDGSGHVAMSSGYGAADVLTGKTLKPPPAPKVSGRTMSCVLTIRGRGKTIKLLHEMSTD